MSKKKVSIVRSESWLKEDIVGINKILQETVEELITSDEKIINVQVVEENGFSRFWIYIIKED